MYFFNHAGVILRAVLRALIITVVLGQLLLVSGCMMASPEQQREKNEPVLVEEGIIALTVGEKAPAMATSSTGGNEVSLPGTLDGNRALLFFYPSDFTPNTTREMSKLSKIAAELDADGILVYGIARGSVADHAEYAEKFAITVPLLADPDMAISAAYGCAKEGGLYSQRTLVGIETDGTVAFYERGFDPQTNEKTIREWFDPSPDKK